MKIHRVLNTLRDTLSGKDKAIELSLICLFAQGHLLIEDLPGIGKTTLALVLAKTLGLTFGRIQGTSDLLPSDITGSSVYNKRTESFVFQKGPIFNNVVLVDEINRMSPKTQSALLEPMEEGQVTVDGVTYSLPKPFFLIATQNPIEYFGTFPLPEAQLDRFLMKISIGYPPRAIEREILQRGSLRDEKLGVQAILTPDEVLAIQSEVKKVKVSEKVLDYLLDLVEKTREHPYIRVGLSSRGALSLLAVSKARAYLQDRDFVIPEDIKELSFYVIPHRILLQEEYVGKEKTLLKEILEDLKAPVQ
ncbi:MAG: MoxR family ATPase [Caldimicrobium sp.]|nr:AAA family ATPase [Caldimicrobium sp.]MCX7613703.1 AAA family ATPase [Caldimicrobium sp.]MDW8093969.1 MoxR family ATPase [Caldimicrobium sp.]MDW8183122.1 MoxR family ATPase [Caldimicrobium sp.]